MKSFYCGILLIVGLAQHHCTYAQGNFNEAVATHVSHIEEFIDRFNFDKDSQFNQFVRATYPHQKIDRSMVVKSLFNRRTLSSTPPQDRLDFIAYVADSLRPVHLAIYDALWYATVPVQVTIDNQKMDMMVTLEIQMNNDYSIEWAIVGLKSPSLEEMKSKSKFYISASSHATYFPELYAALSSSDLFKSVIADSQKETNTEKYLNLISGREVQDITIKKGIKYHFLQISGWIMTVEYVPQDYSFNTGWLISKVTSVDSFLEKRKYQKNVLGITGTP